MPFSDDDALTAPGGVCAPLAPYYDMDHWSPKVGHTPWREFGNVGDAFMAALNEQITCDRHNLKLDADSRPVRDSLPPINMERGAIKYAVPTWATPEGIVTRHRRRWRRHGLD